MAACQALNLKIIVRFNDPHPTLFILGQYNIFILLKGLIFQTATAMSGLISQFAEISTAIMSQVSTVATTIVDTPLLLFTSGFLFLGGCIGMFGRMLSRN